MSAQTQRAYQARKESGRCTRPGCAATAGDTVLCDQHAADARDRNRRSQSRTRAARAALGLCVQCGAKSRTYRCLACRARLAPPSRSDHNGADNTPPQAEVDRWRPDPGTNWRRYRGKARRGKPPDALLDDQDLSFAVEELSRAKDGMAYARSDEVRALPKIQRDGVKQAALDRLKLSKRWIDEILERHKGRNKSAKSQ